LYLKTENVNFKYALFFRSAGMLIPYILGAYLHWKIIAQVATIVPLGALIMALFVPESPTFLVRKVMDTD